MHIPWADLFTGTTFITSVKPSTQARGVTTYTEKAVSAIQVLNEEFYNSATGVWDNAWWSSANVSLGLKSLILDTKLTTTTRS